MSARPIRGRRQYQQLARRKPSLRTWDAGRQVITYARENDVPIADALRDLKKKGVKTSRGSVKKYWGDAITRDAHGRAVATKADRYLRVLNALTPGGVREIMVVGSRNATIVSEHENAVRAYLFTGDPTRLRSWGEKYGDKVFRDAAGARVSLETDIDVIDLRDQRGEISYEDLYPEIT